MCFSASVFSICSLRWRRPIFCLRRRLNLALSPLTADIDALLQAYLESENHARLRSLVPYRTRITGSIESGEILQKLLGAVAPARQNFSGSTRHSPFKGISQSRRRNVLLGCLRGQDIQYTLHLRILPRGFTAIGKLQAQIKSRLESVEIRRAVSRLGLRGADAGGA